MNRRSNPANRRSNPRIRRTNPAFCEGTRVDSLSQVSLENASATGPPGQTGKVRCGLRRGGLLHTGPTAERTRAAFDDAAVCCYYSYVGGDVGRRCARTAPGCCRNANGTERTGCGRAAGIVPRYRLGYMERERGISRSGDRRVMHVALQTPSRTRRRAAPSRPIGRRLSAITAVVMQHRLGGDPC